jgi:hypothetical protein
MKYIIVFFLLFFFTEKLHAGSFTTIFGSEGATSVSNSKARSLSYSLQYLTVSGSIGFVAKQLFEGGFFEPLGFIPDSYKSLSPLAYDKDVIKTLSRKQNLIVKTKEEIYKLNNISKVSSSGDLKISEYINYENKRKDLINRYFDEK